MHETAGAPVGVAGEGASTAGLVRLGEARPGDRGVIAEVRADHTGDHTGDHAVDVHELERRLLEFGFVEGAAVEVLHQGLFGADPIAVKLDDMRIALRRRDATDIWVRLDRARIDGARIEGAPGNETQANETQANETQATIR